MKFQNILFDLDGTLTDPGVGIKNSIRYALLKANLSSLTEETLNSFIGPPLLDSFQKHCGVSFTESEQLLKFYREYFSQKGIYENTVYPSVPAVLEALQKQGKRIYLATSKPEPFALRILEHFSLMPFFTFVGGSTMQETRTDKAEVIRYVMESNGLTSDSCLMVGDRSYDVDGAHQCGLAAAGVLYGYGSFEELNHAEYILKTPKDLLLI
jgi:phosphoglycolate phosphatase